MDIDLISAQKPLIFFEFMLCIASYLISEQICFLLMVLNMERLLSHQAQVIIELETFIRQGLKLIRI